jgi:intracellular sulfur oxidation DsrE/DsrF family protein
MEIMNRMSRRSFVSTAATGVAVLAAMGTVNSAEGQLVYTKSDWKLNEFNQLAKNPALVKQVYDVTRIAEGGYLNNIKNSLNGLHFGFGVPEEQIKIVAAQHGPANQLNFDDFIWNKYQIGAWLKVTDPSTGQPAVKNLFYPSNAGKALHYSSEDPASPESLYQDTSIQALQHRGVKLLACHTATEEQARALIAHNSLTQQPEEIVKEMLAHTLPEVLVVAAMVAAIALLQTDGHYSYISV